MVCVSSFGIQPSDFWNMDPAEVWWLIEAKSPHLFEEPQRKRLLRLLENGF
jgi:hypothetical protein